MAITSNRSRSWTNLRFFTYAELTKRDKLNLDTFWLKDADIAADLEAALEQFATIAEDLKGGR